VSQKNVSISSTGQSYLPRAAW